MPEFDYCFLDQTDEGDDELDEEMPTEPFGLDYCFLDQTDEGGVESASDSQQKSIEVRTSTRDKQIQVAIAVRSGLDKMSDVREEKLNRKATLVGQGVNAQSFCLSGELVHDDPYDGVGEGESLLVA